MLKMLLLAGAVALSGSAAHATLSLTVTDNGAPVSGTTTLTPGGLDFTSTSDLAFASISVSGVGFPAIPSPDLGTITLDAHFGGTGTHVLAIDMLQSGLTAFPGGVQTTTDTVNQLIGSPGPTTLTQFFNGVQLNTHTTAAGIPVDTASFTDTLGPVAGAFTDAQSISATFGGGAPQVLEAAMQFRSAAVPEPAAIVVLGVGLIGLAAVRRRRAD
jgi:hypothetical protein